MQNQETNAPLPHLTGEKYSHLTPAQNLRRRGTYGYVLALVSVFLAAIVGLLIGFKTLPMNVVKTTSSFVAITIVAGYCIGLFCFLRAKGFNPIIWLIGVFIAFIGLCIIGTLLNMPGMVFGAVSTLISFPIYITTRKDSYGLAGEK